MSLFKMPELKIGNITSRLPIIQGGMGVGVSLSGLASAVAEQGGIGVIATAGIGLLEPDLRKNYKEANARALRNEILKAKSKTQGIIGVNIMIGLSDHETLLMSALDAGADIIFMGAGLPLKIPQIIGPERMALETTRIVPIISSGRAAEVICKSWQKSGYIPTAFVVEGPMAGGHLGFKKEQINDSNFQLENLLTEVLEAVAPFEQSTGQEIPVIAGGGIFTGEDIYKIMQRGAAGVQMATRFVATHECDADIRFKESYVRSKQEDLIIIDSPLGLPGRAVRNNFLDQVAAGEKQPFKCPWKCLRTCDFREAPYCIALALANAKEGLLDNGFAFAGANAWRIKEIKSVQELMTLLELEYSVAVENGYSLLRAIG